MIETEFVPELDLSRYEGLDKVVHFTDYLDAKKLSIPHKFFKCGFDFFNSKIEGLQTGEVAVVTGNTKHGKTLFVESWIKSMVELDYQAKAVIFTFEVQGDKFFLKYSDDPAIALFAPMSLKTMDFDWLRDRCQEARDKFGARIVMIDHLHFLIDMNIKQNITLNIGAFMRRLKHEIALGLDMAVVLIAHQGQPKEEHDATLSGIRDSSFVAQEADMVIVVSRHKNFDPVDLIDYGLKHGAQKQLRVTPPPGVDDDYSAQLAMVNIECARRSGAFKTKKLFKKIGHFLEEI